MRITSPIAGLRKQPWKGSPPRALLSSRAPLALMVVALGLGCTRANPAYRGPADGAAPVDVSQTGDGSDVGGGDAARDGTARDGKGDLPGDANPDNPLACVVAMDCVSRNPPIPCGAWTCPGGTCVLVCPNCVDGDHDGYGVGAGCAGPDCDDNDPMIRSTGQRGCYSGPAGTAGVGVCRAGSQSCSAGVWTMCAGQVIPSPEACNNEDDDCDGNVDEDLPVLTCGSGACLNLVPSCTAGVVGACVPRAGSDHDNCDVGTPVDNDCDGQIDEECPAALQACIHVAPDGDDMTGDGSTTNPYASIPAGIAAAATTSKTVCVASGHDCAARATYTLTDLFQMANGVSVFGNYQSDPWFPCPLDPTAPDPHVTLDLREMGGVRFPSTINTPTTLDSFVLQRASGGGITTTSAVTVNGASKVRLSNLVVNDTPSVAQSYGINLINGGEALITRCSIAGGAGTGQSFGIRSTGNSKPTVRENCSNIDATTGRCLAACAQSPGLGIFGRIASGNGGGNASTAVHLENSPGASIETSTLCADEATQAVGVRIIGNAAGTIVRGNNIAATAGVTDSVGVWTQDCLDAAPWIVDNQSIQAQGGNTVVGVLGMGSCDPVIDSNVLIAVSGDGTTNEAIGVSCQANTNGEASVCNVLGNDMIRGSDSFRATSSAGVACREKGCARVADNVIVGNEGNGVIGLWLRNDGVTVERNRITGGCAQAITSSTGVLNGFAQGVLADDSYSRLQNNLISGGSCAVSLPLSQNTVGVRVFNADDLNEVDIHSNTIDGGGNIGVCNSLGIDWAVGPETPPTASKGIVRNNIVRAGACATHFDFYEALASADPRLLENNDLDPTGAPVLYANEVTTYLRDIAAVNALPGASNNISANPMFVSPTDLHLGAGSACVGAGTSVGAPTTDFDHKKRSTTKPSIGAYE